ncbi:xanthine dehydrogenase accessory protein XdhC [Aliiroseovarius crassostreae]|uniref:Xanthine dehydrogenase accessory protein XdhC n=1 Tax=Aliiroseovarius crassostreae TaxID=154981 RepID=A0A9Q9HA80_9RHOB|nr:xanthine dehydrogenase accessory protein XdhC [Aliiroseovarius crassostreae]UWP95818.1 xanthine dehydrogenase accessory protein XdhC [Aliiroseovarius crassostreae]
MSFDLPTLERTICDHGPVVRVVVAEVKGSAPRDVGAAMLVWAEGQSGTIGGGELEWRAARKARQLLKGGRAFDRYPLGPALGQCCGGAVSLLSECFDLEKIKSLKNKSVYARSLDEKDPPLAVHRALQQARDRGVLPTAQLVQGWMIEPITPARQPLWIYGAGHVGRALINTLAPVPDFVITWVDTGPERFPEQIPDGVTALPATAPNELVRYAPQHAQHLVLTYSHQLDLDLCHTILLHGHGGLGLIGSATKWARFRARLRDLGHGNGQINQITCPIGDPGLGKHPQAIAIGVATALMKGAVDKTNQNGFQNRGIPTDGGDARAGRAVDA